MSEFKFLDYITEGKMIRNSDGVSRMTFTDASDLDVMLHLIVNKFLNGKIGTTLDQVQMTCIVYLIL